MTPLARQIAEIIRRDGPIGIDRYWNIALYDRGAGYYATRNPLGRAGDFVTAPEVSQIFGELIGAWVAAAWAALGRPRPFRLVELGPGRGTLMADMLRTLRGVAPDCLAAASIRLVETSESLAAIQAATLERFDLPIRRCRRFEEIEPGPAIVVANELFDALAIRQIVFDGEAFRERLVGLSETNRLEFVLGPQMPKGQEAGGGLPLPMAGAVLEVSPERDRLAARIAARLASEGGAALFFDYGHAETGYGDTLQAVRAHAFADPLDRPGEADLTSHVDFQQIGAQFAAAGLVVSPVREQGDVLLALGLLERAGQLGASGDAATRRGIEQAVARLAGNGEGQMGSLFKVLSAATEQLPLPPFDAAVRD